MARKTGNCPGCGGDVEFHSLMSLVTVCPYCHSVVARQDRQLSDQGKIAEITDSLSPLQLGLRGVWRGKAFRLIGRVQYKHSAGGVWDEWYASFTDRKSGWLFEAQGRFGMLLAESVMAPAEIPPQASLVAGQRMKFDNQLTLQVSEVGHAVVAAAEGDLPFSPIIQAEHRFADLEGSHGEFATIDYSDGDPVIYLGESATLKDLGLADAALKQQTTKTVGSLQLNCPKCAGPLELVQPDAAQRVTCPNCRSLLGVEGQKLEYLTTLKPPQPALKIPLGSKAKLGDIDYQVLGYLRRSVKYDKEYFWQEYLLYAPRHGYAWLIESDDHWSLGEFVPSAEVERSEKKAVFHGQHFQLFQQHKAKVCQVWGEFYWKVAIDDEVQLFDYISPPFSLSVEITSTSTGEESTVDSEINATLSHYLPHKDVEHAFGLSPLPRGWGVAPNQPNPFSSMVLLHWFLVLIAIGAAYFLFPVYAGREVDLALTLWAAVLSSVVPLSSLIYGASFEIRRWQDSEFSPYANSGDSGSSDDDD